AGASPAEAGVAGGWVFARGVKGGDARRGSEGGKKSRGKTSPAAPGGQHDPPAGAADRSVSRDRAAARDRAEIVDYGCAERGAQSAHARRGAPDRSGG